MRLLIDANIYSAMHRGDRSVQDLFLRSDKILVSAIVLGELLHGFELGTKQAGAPG